MDIKYPFIEDKDAVMERLGSNEALLGKLMTKFHDNYMNARTDLFDFLERGDREEAYRLVHSVKGVSANLGIGSLYRLSIALENRMKAGDYDDMMPELIAFLSELEAVIQTIG